MRLFVLFAFICLFCSGCIGDGIKAYEAHKQQQQILEQFDSITKALDSATREIPKPHPLSPAQ